MYYVLRTVTLPCRDALSYKAGQPTHALAWCEPYQIFEERASHFIGQTFYRLTSTTFGDTVRWIDGRSLDNDRVYIYI